MFSPLKSSLKAGVFKEMFEVGCLNTVNPLFTLWTKKVSFKILIDINPIEHSSYQQTIKYWAHRGSAEATMHFNGGDTSGKICKHAVYRSSSHLGWGGGIIFLNIRLDFVLPKPLTQACPKTSGAQCGLCSNFRRPPGSLMKSVTCGPLYFSQETFMIS